MYVFVSKTVVYVYKLLDHKISFCMNLGTFGPDNTTEF